MLENLMTLKEVAALLRVSPQTIYKMLEHGGIPAVKIGSQWRFDREEIREWIRKQASPIPNGTAPAADEDRGFPGGGRETKSNSAR